jgi:acetolactate decarboxylase
VSGLRKAVMWICAGCACVIGLAATTAAAQEATASSRAGTVYSVGDLRQIAERQLNGKVARSALEGEGPLFAIGMPHGLNQEVLVLDNKVYLGRFDGLRYYNAIDVALPPVAFLVYARVSQWRSVTIPPTIMTFQRLEAFVRDAASANGIASDQPFPFRIEAKVRSLRWFVVGGDGNSLPDPRTSFMRERRIGPLSERKISALGFYVPGERGILTNPMSHIHVHFVTRDRQQFVGHLDDEIVIDGPSELLLPL